MFDFSIQQIILGLVVAAASSLLGVFIILRRMALVSDVLSHVALPGVAIAMMLGIDPFIGAFLSLLMAVSFIVLIEKKYQFSMETLVGVFFTASLAIGLLLMGDDLEHLTESLFGDISKITIFDFWTGIVLGAIIFLATIVFFRKFAQVTFSRELAQSQGADIGKMDYLFLLLVALIIGIGIKVVGVLLMGALMILPVSVAKNLSGSLKGMAIKSIIIGLLMVLAGFLIGGYFNISVSATIILIGAILFLLSFIFV